MTFLTAAEVARLTGYERPSKQIEWLRARRLRHFVNAVGHPVVPRMAVEGTVEQRPEAAPRALRLVGKRV